jgi:hypothetical protein
MRCNSTVFLRFCRQIVYRSANQQAPGCSELLDDADRYRMLTSSELTSAPLRVLTGILAVLELEYLAIC